MLMQQLRYRNASNVTVNAVNVVFLIEVNSHRKLPLRNFGIEKLFLYCS